jgi:hypothetical protein
MKLCHVLKFIETSIFVEALGTHFGDPFFWPSESVRDGSEAVGPNLVDLLELSEHVRKQTHNVLPMKWQYAMLYFQVHTKESGSGAQGLPVNSNHHVLAELFEVAKGLVSSHPNN